MDDHSAVLLEDGDYDLQAVSLTPEEIAGVQDAQADYEARGGIPWNEVKAWLDSLDTANPLPEPKPRKL